DVYKRQQYTIRIEKRDLVARKLEERGIPTGIYYPKCLHQLPVFEHLGYRVGEFPNAERAAEEVLSLPMHPYLDEATQDFIVDSIIEIVRDI
ncbi:MAG: DegT/DnrJ/EryC1/StrS family aminotransferase, partial [Chthoniobacterales bacterium]|nr:DegT/DnrJ/EryC1/StrS family aminotransferase [Chthoniobacterales bacterium]